MSIRLSKVVKDLNVGLSTAVEFLQKKGQTVDANPNTKISEEQYTILIKEFSTDKNLKIESERFIQQRQEKEKAPHVAIDEIEEEKPKPVEKKKEPEVVEAKMEETKLPGIKEVGKIDLDSINKPQKKAEPKVETAPVKEEKVEKPVEKKQEELKVVEPEKVVEIKVEPIPEPVLPVVEVVVEQDYIPWVLRS
jgi:translation initiation factor IF-2